MLTKAIKVRLYPTKRKQNSLLSTIDSFCQMVQDKIEAYWELHKVEGAHPPKGVRLSSRLGSDASKIAWRMIKATKSNGGKKPILKQRFIELNQFSGRITGRTTKTFDLWLSVIDVNNKWHRLYIPAKRTRRLNKFLDDGWQLRKGFVIKPRGKKLFAHLTLCKQCPPLKEMGEILGADIGYRKLLVLSDGEVLGKEISNLIDAYYKRNVRCPRTVGHYINRIIKQLPLDSTRILVIENLKHLRKEKKGKWSKDTNRRFNSWCYSFLIRRLRELAKENGVLLWQVNPKDTSKECPECHDVRAANRNGERFKCLRCGYEADADWVGAVNILSRFELETAGSVAVGGKGDKWL